MSDLPWYLILIGIGWFLGWVVDARHVVLRYFRRNTITDDPDEWCEVGWGMWQNRKAEQGEAFSDDRGRTYWLLSEGAHSRNRNPRHTSKKSGKWKSVD